VPSWHITVVLESAGTITVVVFAGGGLLLLMQPDSVGIRINKLARTFITSSFNEIGQLYHCMRNPGA
jgi:hypothetical protein